MDKISIALAIWAVFCLAGAWYQGRYHPTWWAFRYSDPIYYPLAILGGALLFTSNNNLRALAELRDQLTSVEAQIIQHDKSKLPPVANTGAETISQSYHKLRSKIEEVDRCRSDLLASLGSKCTLEGDSVAVLKQDYDGFEVPTDPKPNLATAEKVQDFCARGKRVIDDLVQKGDTYEMVFGPLRDALADLTKPSQSSGSKSIAAIKTELSNKLVLDGYNFTKQLPEDLKTHTYMQWSANTEFAENLFDAFSMCATVPEHTVVVLKSWDTWKLEDALLQDRKSDLQKQINESKDTPPSGLYRVISFVLNMFWPFVLVLPLALKFGKGIAALRSDK